MKYKDFSKFKELLITKRIVEWNKDKLVLDDGTVVTIEMTENDCCASAGGTFSNVVLDAMITDVSDPIVTKDEELEAEYGDGGNCYSAIVNIFHNQNIVAQANCHADDGNGGFYYSVASFIVKDIAYKIVEA